MTMTLGAIDTPDFQHGVISAQKLLGVIPAGQLSLTVDVPVNAETVVAMVQNQASKEGAWCQGVSSGMFYPSGAIVMSNGEDSTTTVWFDVSAAVDNQVTVNLFTAAAGPTSIYGDSAVHTTNDPVTIDVLHNAMDAGNNAMYTISRPPGTGAGDHPPVELQAVTASAGNGGPLLAPAGSGQRYRIFSTATLGAGAAGEGYIYDTSSGGGIALVSTLGPISISFAPSGLPLGKAGGVNLTSAVNGYGAWATIVYTTETV